VSEAAAPAPRRTAPLGMLVGAASGIRQSVLPAAAGAYGLRDEFGGVGFIVAFATLVVLLGAIGSVVRWWRTTYVIGSEDIRMETGVVRRKARSVPYERIQDVSLEQPLLARVLGLAQVRLETGAGGADEIALAYLSMPEAERLRELVRNRRDEAEDGAMEGAAADGTAGEPGGEVLFAMSARRMALFGLFEFSLAAVAVLAGATQQFDFLLPFDIWEWREWSDRLGLSVDELRQVGPLVQAGAIVLAIAVLAVVGIATGLARTFARDWGFVLERTAKGFRRRRGLFNRTDVVMPAHRVQALQLRTGLVRRRFGWHALKFVSLAHDAGSASHVVAPFAQIEEIAPIAREAGFGLPTEGAEWRRPAKRAFIDAALLGSLVPLAAGAAFLWTPVPQAAPLPLLALPLIALSQTLGWMRARYALDGSQLYVRRGWFAPRIDVGSRVKLQSAEIVQGPLGRRGGYATLHLGLAGGTLALPALTIDEAQRIRSAALDSMVATDFSKIA
jgi:putative membrane protein